MLVSHDLAALEEYCDRVLLLNHGQIIADGPAAEVTSAYHRMVADHAMAIAQESPRQRLRARSESVGREAVQIMSVAPARRKGPDRRGSFDTGGSDDSRHPAARASRTSATSSAAWRSVAVTDCCVAGTNTFLDHVTVSSHPPGRVISIRYTIELAAVCSPAATSCRCPRTMSADSSDVRLQQSRRELSHRQHRRSRGPARDARRWHVERDDDVPAGGAVRQNAR